MLRISRIISLFQEKMESSGYNYKDMFSCAVLKDSASPDGRKHRSDYVRWFDRGTNAKADFIKSTNAFIERLPGSLAVTGTLDGYALSANGLFESRGDLDTFSKYLLYATLFDLGFGDSSRHSAPRACAGTVCMALKSVFSKVRSMCVNGRHFMGNHTTVIPSYDDCFIGALYSSDYYKKGKNIPISVVIGWVVDEMLNTISKLDVCLLVFSDKDVPEDISNVSL